MVLASLAVGCSDQPLGVGRMANEEELVVRGFGTLSWCFFAGHGSNWLASDEADLNRIGTEVRPLLR